MVHQHGLTKNNFKVFKKLEKKKKLKKERFQQKCFLTTA